MTGGDANPYVAPTAADNPTVVDAPELHGRMPGSIQLSLIGLAAIVGGTALTLVNDLVHRRAVLPGVDAGIIVIGSLLIIGVARRVCFAKRAGQLLLLLLLAGFCTFLLAALAAVVVLSRTHDESLVSFDEVRPLIFSIDFAVFLFVAVSSVVAFIGLGRPSAKQFFGLVCPQCQSHRTKAANFRCTKSRCKDCQAVW